MSRAAKLTPGIGRGALFEGHWAINPVAQCCIQMPHAKLRSVHKSVSLCIAGRALKGRDASINRHGLRCALAERADRF